MSKGNSVFQWESDIYILRQSLVLKQLGLLVIITGAIMSFLLSLMLIAAGDYKDIPKMLLISLYTSAGLGLAILLVILLFYRNKTRVRFTINKKGIRQETIGMNPGAGAAASVVGGLIGKSFSTAGAGLLGAVRHDENIHWHMISSARGNITKSSIIVSNSWRPLLLIVCPPDKFSEILSHILERIPSSHGSETPAVVRHPLAQSLFHSAFITITAFPLLYIGTRGFAFDLLLPLIIYLFSLAMIWLIPLFGWVVIGTSLIAGGLLLRQGFNANAFLAKDEMVIIFLSITALLLLIFYSFLYLRGKYSSLLFRK